MRSRAFFPALVSEFFLDISCFMVHNVVESTFSLRPAAPAFVEFAMRFTEHNIIRADRSPRTGGAVALTLGRRWYFDLFYFWFTYLKGGSLGK